ncbi:MAG: membrane protein insertase YidC [Elusimicrobia bacterium]|nr:membrane protein insertase YidC [Elusimicrobiota bacterium]
MQKNTLMFVLFSTIFLLAWYMFFQPTPQQQMLSQTQNEQKIEQTNNSAVVQDNKQILQNADKTKVSGQQLVKEEEIIVETEKYKVVFTNKGAAVKNWYIRESNGALVDLVLPEASPVLANFPGSVYEIAEKTDSKIVFSYTFMQDWKITKIFDLSKDYLHSATVKLEKLRQDAKLPDIDFDWGPGLGTDDKELKENVSVTRVLGYTSTRPSKLEKIKEQNNPAQIYKWTAIDNRYFLAAFIPDNSLNFSNVGMIKQNKRTAPIYMLSAKVKQEEQVQTFSFKFYVGPKSYSYLKTFDMGLEKTVDFGFFGFLGRIAMSVLFAIYGLTNNYGWAIIIMTILIQILVLPLTLKTFKSTAAMKKIQPIIKDLQTKYKNDPKRLQVEMMNLYRTQKVNPFGGCLPLFLQLPIFWALFTTLRNAYELRYAPWVLWVKDLSASDSLFYMGSISFNLLPLIMGLGMFLQQKMTTATSDPTQRKMMYIMPLIFTLMFWGFPSGLVLYWLTNSVVSMIVQFFVLRKEENR